MPAAQIDEKTTFNLARRIDSREARAEYLEQVFGDNRQALARVAELLQIHDQDQSFLESPAVALGSIPLEETLPRLAGQQPGTQIGPYKLLEQIGEGGMGLVYMAEQQQPVRRLVAMKLVKPGMDSKQVIARFEAERQALALMDHPNIARVLDAGTTEAGRPFFVMDLVRGLPINEFCDQKRLTVRERLELFIQVCQAVQHAHQKGVIHRDLKPTNILVTMHDSVAVPRVIDFGIAKALGQALTEHTLHTGFAQLVGTPLYMSPEQAELNQLGVDTRSDVYSLGVLLYELLTGTTPFDKETLSKAGLDEMRRMIREDEPPRPSARVSTLQAQALSTVSERRRTDPRRISSTLRGELDWIVMKALEKDRSHRYESASAFAADIQRYLSNEPVQAYPPSAAYRLLKFVRRNQSRVAAAGLAVALLAVVAIGGVTTYSQHVTTQRQIVQDVQQSLAAAKTAIEASDLSLADKRVAEAQGRLGDHRSYLKDTAADVDKLVAELDARRADQERFDKFIKLARVAPDRMTMGDGLPGDRFARQALEMFGVLNDPSWVERLNKSYLTPTQRSQVVEMAYETTITVADYLVHSNRAQKEPQPAQESLKLLDQARSFHEPTRAFWFVRRVAHLQLKDNQAAQEDDQRFQTTEAKSGWDHFLPGHTARWDGNIDEAIRSYQAALRVQPDHYNSLFFLAMAFSDGKANRKPEAIAYYSACIALRPGQTSAYMNRALCYTILGQFDEAEADLNNVCAWAEKGKDDAGRLLAYEKRYKFYRNIGREEKAEQDLSRWAAVMHEVRERHQANLPNNILPLMKELAHVYAAVGKFNEALPLYEDALNLTKARLGPDHVDTLTRMNELGHGYQEAGQFDEAIRIRKATFELAKANLHPDHPKIAATMGVLGRAYLAAGKFDEALPLLKEAFERRTAHLGPDNPSRLIFMGDLALAYKDAGDFAQALSLLEVTVERQKATQGHSEKTLTGMASLAECYEAVGKRKEALVVWDEIFDVIRKSPGNRELQQVMENLGMVYKDTGRFDQALELVHEVVKVREANFGREDPDTLNSRNNLAAIYLAAGKADLALPLLQDTLKMARPKLGPDHLFTLEAVLRLPVAFQALGKTDEALPLAEEAYQAIKTKFGPEHAWTWEAMQNLADVHQAAGRLDEAQDLYQKTLDLRKAKLGPEHRDTLLTTASLGSNLLRQQKYASAEPLLVAAYEGLTSRADTIPSYAKPRVTEALQRLIELYTAWDKPEEAARWRVELEARTANLQEANPSAEGR